MCWLAAPPVGVATRRNGDEAAMGLLGDLGDPGVTLPAPPLPLPPALSGVGVVPSGLVGESWSIMRKLVPQDCSRPGRGERRGERGPMGLRDRERGLRLPLLDPPLVDWELSPDTFLLACRGGVVVGVGVVLTPLPPPPFFPLLTAGMSGISRSCLKVERGLAGRSGPGSWISLCTCVCDRHADYI